MRIMPQLLENVVETMAIRLIVASRRPPSAAKDGGTRRADNGVVNGIDGNQIISSRYR